jgi:hypothetical protein
MREWLSYSLQDILMFSPRVYYRLIEQYNADLWPAGFLAFGAGGAILLRMLRPSDVASRICFVILGLAWAWTGWAFLWGRFAAINWPMLYVAPAFALEALLLAGLGIAGTITLAPRRNLPALIVFAAALLYPLVARLTGRDWASAEVFGLMPDPTVIATLALLAASAGPWRWVLMVVPALWCVISSLTLWTMGAAEFFVPAAAVVITIGIGLAPDRSGSHPTPSRS